MANLVAPGHDLAKASRACRASLLRRRDRPVMFAPGCARVSTTPNPTGSETPTNTTGVVFTTLRVSTAPCDEATTMTSGFALARSASNAAKRSTRPSPTARRSSRHDPPRTRARASPGETPRRSARWADSEPASTKAMRLRASAAPQPRSHRAGQTGRTRGSAVCARLHHLVGHCENTGEIDARRRRITTRAPANGMRASAARSHAASARPGPRSPRCRSLPHRRAATG